jgi:hypothetical protein
MPVSSVATVVFGVHLSGWSAFRLDRNCVVYYGIKQKGRSIAEPPRL